MENTLDLQNTQSAGNAESNNQVAGLYTLANIKPWDSYQQFNENPYNSDGVQNSPQNSNPPLQNVEPYAAGINTPQDGNLPAQNLEAFAAGLNTFGTLNSDPLHQFIGAAVNEEFQPQNNGR